MINRNMTIEMEAKMKKKCCFCGSKKDLIFLKKAIMETYHDCDVLIKEDYICKLCLSKGKIKNG